MTDGEGRIDSDANITKNMGDFLLYGCDEKGLKESLEQYMFFVQEKNLKLK